MRSRESLRAKNWRVGLLLFLGVAALTAFSVAVAAWK